jgi:hypothetical protein
VKLLLRETSREKQLLINVEVLAVSYGMRLPVAASIIYDSDEFLALLEEPQEVDHDNALD